jgi:hypothetical protein
MPPHVRRGSLARRPGVPVCARGRGGTGSSSLPLGLGAGEETTAICRLLPRARARAHGECGDEWPSTSRAGSSLALGRIFRAPLSCRRLRICCCSGRALMSDAASCRRRKQQQRRIGIGVHVWLRVLGGTVCGEKALTRLVFCSINGRTPTYSMSPLPLALLCIAAVGHRPFSLAVTALAVLPL